MASSSTILPCGDSATTVLVCMGDHDVPRCECIVAHVDWNNFFLKVSNPGGSSYTAAALESALKAFKNQFVVGNKELICCLQKKFKSLGVRVQPCFVFNLLQPGGEIYEALDVKTFRALRQAALGSCHSYIDRGCLEAFTLAVGQRIGFPVTLTVSSKKGCESEHLELDLVFVQSSLSKSSLIFQEDCRLLSICSTGAGVGMTGTAGVIDPVAQDLVSLWAYGGTDCHITLTSNTTTGISLDTFLDNYVHLLGCSGMGGCAIRVCLQIDLSKSHITTPGVSLSDVWLAATGGSTTVTPGQCICFPRSLTPLDNPLIHFVNRIGTPYETLSGCIILKVSVEGCLDDCGITALPTFSEYNLTLNITPETSGIGSIKIELYPNDQGGTQDIVLTDILPMGAIPEKYTVCITAPGGGGGSYYEDIQTSQFYTGGGGGSGVATIFTLPAYATDTSLSLIVNASGIGGVNQNPGSNGGPSVFKVYNSTDLSMPYELTVPGGFGASGPTGASGSAPITETTGVPLRTRTDIQTVPNGNGIGGAPYPDVGTTPGGSGNPGYKCVYDEGLSAFELQQMIFGNTVNAGGDGSGLEKGYVELPSSNGKPGSIDVVIQYSM